jgi:ribulose-phosphate 3-epimerase
MLNTLSNKPLLEVDGGVNSQNIAGIARAGADVLVAGASIFGTDDYAQTIAALKAAANSN